MNVLNWYGYGEYLGNIRLGDTVDVSDPCYTSDVWCRERLSNVMPGEYHCYLKRVNFDDWGERVARIMVHNIDYCTDDDAMNAFDGALDSDKFELETLLGVIGVDSGQAGFFDTDSFDFDKEGKYDDPNTFYGKCCQATLSDTRAGIIDNSGFVSESGIGDGVYDLVLLRNRKDSRIVAMEIVFLGEDCFCDDESEN